MDDIKEKNLEEFIEKAKEVLEEFSPSLLITTILECKQSSKISYLAPVNCEFYTQNYSR